MASAELAHGYREKSLVKKEIPKAAVGLFAGLGLLALNAPITAAIFGGAITYAFMHR